MYDKPADAWWYDESASKEAQAAFEACAKGHTPKIDTRTPKQVEEQAILEGWR